MQFISICCVFTCLSALFSSVAHAGPSLTFSNIENRGWITPGEEDNDMTIVGKVVGTEIKKGDQLWMVKPRGEKVAASLEKSGDFEFKLERTDFRWKENTLRFYLKSHGKEIGLGQLSEFCCSLEGAGVYSKITSKGPHEFVVRKKGAQLDGAKLVIPADAEIVEGADVLLTWGDLYDYPDPYVAVSAIVKISVEGVKLKSPMKLTIPVHPPERNVEPVFVTNKIYEPVPLDKSEIISQSKTAVVVSVKYDSISYVALIKSKSRD